MNKSKGILPAKTLTRIQCIACIALMALIVITSFSAIFTVKIEKSEGAVEMFDKIVNSLGEGEKAEMPEEVEVSAPYIIKSIGSVGKIFKGAMSTVKNATELSNSANEMQDNVDNGEYGSVQDDADALNEKANATMESVNEISDALKSPEFVGLIALITVIFQAFGQSFILGLVYAALMSMTIVIPVTAVICLIKAVLALIFNITNPGEGYSKIVKAFGEIFIMFPTLWLMKIIAPQIEFTASVTVMVAAIIAALVIGLVSSRLKAYNDVQFKYINVLQGASLVGVIGYFMFMLNIDKIQIFDAVFSGMPAFMETAKAADMGILLVLMIALIYIAFATCKYIQNIACRMCCMYPAPKQKKNGKIAHANDTFVASTAIALALVAIPVALMVTSFKLDLGDNMKYFVPFAAGVIMMFVAEVVFSILKKGFGVAKEDVRAVLTGCPDAPEADEEADEEAAEEATEAVAEEAAEAPTEEAEETNNAE